MDQRSPRKIHAAGIALLLSVILAAANFLVWRAWVAERAPTTSSALLAVFHILAALQAAAALGATVLAFFVAGSARARWGFGLLGALGAFATFAGWIGGLVVAGFARGGGAWGRPLRARGRQLHPELTLGTDWARGLRPDAAALDARHARLLETLWLHDAQKEHASVPAFARVGWLLSAVGAPPELHRRVLRAADEEIDHAERCFALAAGYGGRCHTALPMPELALGIEPVADPVGTLVRESVLDGELLEGFNADVAEACAAVCREPVTRAVLERIAREERDHAAVSEEIVSWVLAAYPARSRAALAEARAAMRAYRRPTAVSAANAGLLRGLDPGTLAAHGRLPDGRWAELWEARLAQTDRQLALRLTAAA